MTRPLLTLAQVAEILNCSRGYAYSLVVRRELRAIELPSRGGHRRGRILIDRGDLDAFIAAHKTEVA